MSLIMSFPFLLVLSRLLLEVDEDLHAGLTMGVDKLVCIIVFLEGEAIAYKRLEVDDALVHIVDGCEIVLVAIHHRADEAQFMLAKMEHAQGWVLGEDSHHYDVATFLDGLHQGTDGNFHTCHLETYLITFLAE